MEFQPTQTDRLGQLTSLLEEFLSTERSGDDSNHSRTSKMNFSSFKQTSGSRDVFTRFYAFEGSVMELQRTLQDFSNTVQHLGSSVGVVASAYHIRFRLDGILRLFRGNVSRIYPEHPLRLPPTRNLIDPAPRHKGEYTRAFHLVDPFTQALPDECLELTKDLETFLKRIKEIPDFTDDIVAELLDSTIRTLSTHMSEWMKSLAEYENLDWPDVRRFLDEMSAELQLDIERLSRSVGSFVSVGIPMIEHAQKRKANGLLNISTVATFFSGVTATALQYSLGANNTGLEQLVNFSWTSALIFSLASAINSQLGYRWQVAAHSSPDPLVPAWLSRWLSDAPLLLLVLSAVLFTLGLVCFSFSAFGGSFIPITTTIFAGISAFGMLIIGAWVIGEEITFSKTHGHHWLREIISDPKAVFGDHFSWMRAFLPVFFADAEGERFAGIRRHWRRLVHRVAVATGLSDGRLGRLFRKTRSVEPVGPSIPEVLAPNGDVEKGYDRAPTPSILQSAPPTPQRATTPLPDITTSETGRYSESSSTLLAPSSASRSRTLVLGVAESVAETTSTKKKRRGPQSTRGWQRKPNLHTWRHADMLHSLRNIVHTHDLSDIEVPYARVMAFSPSGSYLAALSPNQKIKIWETKTMTECGEIAPKDGALQDIQWKPPNPSSSASIPDDEKFVLLRYKNKSTIRFVNVMEGSLGSGNSLVWHRPKGAEIGAMCWLREKSSFLWSEGSTVYIGYADLSAPNTKSSQKGAGKFEFFFDFQSMIREKTHNYEPQNAKVVINNMLVIPGDRRLILTVTLIADEEDDYATRNPEHRVIIFNIEKRGIENFFATFDDLNHISIHKSGMFIVISRRTRPPTVYELKNIQNPGKQAWLDPVLVCEAPAELEFIGTSFLASVLPEGGQTVMSSTKDGVIHVWDRKFGTKLGELVPEDAIPGQIVDSMIWSQDQALLAVAYNKGSIRIFQVPAVLGLQGSSSGSGPGRPSASGDNLSQHGDVASGSSQRTVTGGGGRHGQRHRRNVSSIGNERVVSGNSMAFEGDRGADHGDGENRDGE